MSNIIDKLVKCNHEDMVKGLNNLNPTEVKEVALKLLEEEYKRRYFKEFPPLNDDEKKNIFKNFLEGNLITNWYNDVSQPIKNYIYDKENLTSLFELVNDVNNMDFNESFTIDEVIKDDTTISLKTIDLDAKGLGLGDWSYARLITLEKFIESIDDEHYDYCYNKKLPSNILGISSYDSEPGTFSFEPLVIDGRFICKE